MLVTFDATNNFLLILSDVSETAHLLIPPFCDALPQFEWKLQLVNTK